MRDAAAGSSPGISTLETPTLRRIELPDGPVAGGLYWFDPTTETDGEHELTGRIELPAGARVTVYTDADGPPPDLAFLDVLPSDLPTALYLHGVTGGDVAGLQRFCGLESLGLAGELDDARVADLVVELPRLCVLALDSDGITGACLAALPAHVAQVTLSSRGLDPGQLAALAPPGSVNTLGISRRELDAPLADALIALRPGLHNVFFHDLPVLPDVDVVERLLAAGLEVGGVAAAPGSTAAFARIVVDAMTGDDRDLDDEPTGEPTGSAGDSAGPPGDADEDRPLRSVIHEPDLDALVAEGRPVLVDLTATWCGPCQVLKPVLHEIATELGDQLTVVAVDVEDATWTEQRFDVQSIPTMVLLDEGRELGRISGAHPKRALLAMIAAALPAVEVAR
jgi:thioredoxin